MLFIVCFPDHPGFIDLVSTLKLIHAIHYGEQKAVEVLKLLNTIIPK